MGTRDTDFCSIASIYTECFGGLSFGNGSFHLQRSRELNPLLALMIPLYRATFSGWTRSTSSILILLARAGHVGCFSAFLLER